MSLFTQTITLLVRGTVDTDSVDGSQVLFVDGETVAASVQPVDQTEVAADRDTSIADIVAYILPGPVIEAHDRFRHEGLVYEVIGPPGTWTGLRGADHVEIAGRRVEG